MPVERDSTVSVYGLGYVGSVVAAVMLRAGYSVIGVDVSAKKVEEARLGKIRHVEAKVRETLRRAVEEGAFTATTDAVEASRRSRVKIVAVPVYLTGDGKPDLSSLEGVCGAIAAGCARDDLVVVESSVPPGTTLGVVKPTLEEHSGLRVEEELLLAYSPERIYVGRGVEDVEERYPKVVSGAGPRSLRAVADLYSRVARKGVVEVSSPTVAELEKLAEGVYRDVNIALANELAKLCSALGVDFLEVARAANTQPYCHLHSPGTGVGGYCIPVYPRFLLHAAAGVGLELPLTRLARGINASMPGYVAGLVDQVRAVLGLEDPRVAVLGLAFRGGVDDTRLSPTYDLIDHMLKRGYRRIVVHDPYVRGDETLEKLEIPLYQGLNEALEGSDIVVISTDHPEYRGLSLDAVRAAAGRERVGLVDGRLIVEDWRNPPPGVVYAAVGRPLTIGQVK